MALTERYHSRIEDAGPSTVRFVRVLECLATEVTQGEAGWLGSGVTLPAFGDDYPYSTWAGLPTPRLRDLQVDPNWQKGKALVTCIYTAPRAYGQRAAASGTEMVELNLRRWREYPGRGQWQGMREYTVPDAGLADLMPDLRTLPWAQNGISLTPYHIDVVRSDPEHPGNCRAVLTYRFGDRLGAYQPERARISVEFLGEQIKMSHALKEITEDGRKVLVADPDKGIDTQPDPDGFFWVVETGDNIIFRPQGRLILRTALPQSNIEWDKAWNGIGKKSQNALVINDQVIAYPGELLCVNVGIPEFFIWDSGQSIVPVRYDFLFRKGGFDRLTVRKYRRTVKEEYVMHITDDPVAWAKNPAQNKRRFVKKSDGSIIYGAEPTYDVPSTSDADNCKKREVLVAIPVSEAEDREITTSYDFSWIMSLAAWGN